MVLLNEVLPAPAADHNGDGLIDGEDEFIELYNPGTNSVSLNGGTARYAVEQVATRLLPMGESQRGLIDEEGNTDCKVVNVYRISALGTGGSGASRTLQTVFSVDGC